MNGLARAIGVSGASVCKWENGLAEPKASYIIKLAEYFNCSTDYILGKTNDFDSIKELFGGQASNVVERDIVAKYRQMSRDKQEVFADIARYFSEAECAQDSPATAERGDDDLSASR